MSEVLTALPETIFFLFFLCISALLCTTLLLDVRSLSDGDGKASMFSARSVLSNFPLPAMNITVVIGAN